MAAEQRKAPETEIESQHFAAGASISDRSFGPEQSPHPDRLVGLDARAQSALLEEAFGAPDILQPKIHTSAPSPPHSGLISRFGWRALKSVLGLAIVVVAGVGPVQRLFEFSSTEAVVNSRLISLRAPIDGKIEDFTPTIGTAVPRGRFVLHIANS